MRLLFHFARRDFRDAWIGWLLIALLSYIAFGWLLGLLPRYAILVYGAVAALYFAFALFQSVSFWGGVQNQQSSLTRYYLQSLPIQRSRIFWICLGRGLVTTLPLGLLGLYFPFFMSSLLDWHEIIQPLLTIGRCFCYGLVVLITLFFTPLYACRLATFNQSIRKTVARTQRFFRYLGFLFIDNLVAILATFSAVAAIPLIMGSSDSNKFKIILAVGLLFNLWQLSRSFRQWIYE